MAIKIHKLRRRSARLGEIEIVPFRRVIDGDVEISATQYPVFVESIVGGDQRLPGFAVAAEATVVEKTVPAQESEKATRVRNPMTGAILLSIWALP